MTEPLFIRLPAMARAINAKVKGYTAVIEKAFTSTDSKIAGTRLRREGKGRSGNRLVVTNAEGVLMFDHDASRGAKNDSVAWVIEKLWGPIWNEDCPKAKKLVCSACKKEENKTTRGRYLYNRLSYRVLCPSCNGQLEAGTLK